MTLDLARVRAQFPALQKPVIFFDNPGGTQIAAPSLARIQDYLVNSNANHGGAFPTSEASDRTLEEAHGAMANLLNASRPEEIVFGLNMTTLTFHISRSLGKLFEPGDTLVVTHLDHDANISPWLKIAEDRGCRVRWVDFHLEDGTLDLEDFAAAMQEKPRLVAFGYASNAIGTINPAARLVEMAHDAGALVYIDAVQYAAHGSIDVQALGTDFLVCSSYKFFGPHIGILYGRYDHLERMEAYKVRPAPQEPPGKFMTGTQSFEGIAGVLGAVEYLEWLGECFGAGQPVEAAGGSGSQLVLKQAMAAIQAYEYEVSRRMLETLRSVPGLRLYGIADPARIAERVPTFSFTLEGWTPREAAEELGKRGINVWDGNYYALAVMERLGLEDKGGMIRVGPVHYNTLEEIGRLGEALQEMAARQR